MKWFKTKEEKQKIKQDKLEKQLLELNEKYKNVIDAYHIVDNEPFILKGFRIKDGEIVVDYIISTTPKGYKTFCHYWIFALGGHDFNLSRERWVKFKNQLQIMGLDIKPIETK